MGVVHLVIGYDSPSQKRRNKLFKLLSGVLTRIQYSVFEGMVDSALRNELLESLSSVIDPVEDRIIMFQLCGACSRNRVVLGREEDKDVPGASPVLIV